MPRHSRPREPDRTHEKAPEEEAGNRHRAGNGEGSSKPEVETAQRAGRIEKSNAKPDGNVVQRDQRKGQKAPEDERVREARQWPLANHLGLAEHFPEEVPDALAQRK